MLQRQAFQRLLGMGIEPYFKFVVGHEDTNQSKHTGLPLLLELDMPKKECLQVLQVPKFWWWAIQMKGDREPAKKLGLKTALAKYGQKTIEIGSADFQFLDFKEIFDIVEPFQ
jgi:hypothetical protein